jgi:hypothetical protein
MTKVALTAQRGARTDAELVEQARRAIATFAAVCVDPTIARLKAGIGRPVRSTGSAFARCVARTLRVSEALVIRAREPPRRYTGLHATAILAVHAIRVLSAGVAIRRIQIRVNGCWVDRGTLLCAACPRCAVLGGDPHLACPRSATARMCLAVATRAAERDLGATGPAERLNPRAPATANRTEGETKHRQRNSSP